jgi:hypothetical protein
MSLAKNLIERALRRRENMNAWIRQTDSFATQQCRVLEVSKTDVRLEVANPDTVPDKFILLFAKDGPRHHASVMWRRGTQVGVQCASRPVL